VRERMRVPRPAARMTAESGVSLKRVPRGVNGIIRGSVSRFGAGALALLLAGCLSPGSSHPAPAASTPRTSGGATPSAAPTLQSASVWVLNPVGVNIRAQPDTAAQRVTTLTQGAKLDVQEQRQVAGATWLHVKSASGQIDGWVLDRADLVIHFDVSQHFEGAGWSILFPTAWTLQTGNPTTFTAPASDTLGSSLLVQMAASTDKLLATPTAAGQEVRQESPIEVYGKTTYLTVYKLASGAWEFAVKVQYDAQRSFLFDYKQSARPDADTSLFKQLLTSVIVQG